MTPDPPGPPAPAPVRLRVLVVDDERPALEDLARLLGASPRVADVRTAGGADEALAVLAEAEGTVDVVLLDVRMPGLDGVALARVLHRFAAPPAVVFVSAYEDAAVEAFALRAVDYLLKPVGARRLEQALDRVAEALARPAAAPHAAVPGDEPEPGDALGVPESDVVPVDNVRGGGTRLVSRATILYLQAYGDYVRIVADDGRFLLRARLADIERRWTALGFVRVHRGYVVNLRRAVEVRPRLNGTAVLVFADGSEVPVARRQVGELRRRLRAV